MDRSNEKLSATDIGIVHFRRAMLGGVRALQAGTPPAAAANIGAYRLRAGGAVESAALNFEAVMMKRFGHIFGRAT